MGGPWQPNESAGTWTCAACATGNELMASQCVVCGTPRPSVPEATRVSPTPSQPTVPTTAPTPPPVASLQGPAGAVPSGGPPAPAGPPPDTDAPPSRSGLIIAAVAASVCLVIGAVLGAVVLAGSDDDSSADRARAGADAGADDAGTDASVRESDEVTTTEASTTTTEATTTTARPTTTVTTIVTTTVPSPTVSSSGLVRIDASPDAPSVGAVAETFDGYFSAINAHNFEEAHAWLSPSIQAKTTVAEMEAGASTSYDTDIVLVSVWDAGGGRLGAQVTFTSTQDVSQSRNGSTCTKWSNEYELVASGSAWLIDGIAVDYFDC